MQANAMVYKIKELQNAFKRTALHILIIIIIIILVTFIYIMNLVF